MAMGGTRNPEPHMLLLLYGRDDGVLDTVAGEQHAELARAGIEVITRLDTSWLAKGTEHFGFRDGVSRIDIEGFGKEGRFENTVAAGEFLLGYLNAYGQPSGRWSIPGRTRTACSRRRQTTRPAAIWA
jgi:hypothetical protein